ncbi:MAG TPA: hypothetical protein VFI46_02925 [Jiangellaceae bacterium]|nr:hypothetical protein [Jiangellaceae bacterium]
MTWHISDQLVRRYVSGRLGDADAWSVEAHLVACADCQAAVAGAVSGTETAGVVEHAWSSTVDQLGSQGRVRTGTAGRRLLVLVASGPAARLAWLVSIVLVLAVAALIDGMGMRLSQPVPLLAVVAPLLPVLGVALSYGSGLDHAREIIASTPDGGLRLLLVRTAAVLAVTTPVAFAAGLFAGSLASETSVTWLLPGLVLTLLTLALGSVMGLVRAAAAVGGGWLVAVIGPLLTRDAPPVLTPDARPILLLLGVTAVAVVVVRRQSFETLSFRLEP